MTAKNSVAITTVALAFIFILNISRIWNKRKRGTMLSHLEKTYWVVGIIAGIVVVISGVLTIAESINPHLSSIFGFQLPTLPTDSWLLPTILVVSIVILVAIVKRKKIAKWFNHSAGRIKEEQLQSGLYLMDTPKVVVDGLNDKNPCLWITMVLWSSIPTKLHPNRIIGTVHATEFESEIRWDKEGETILKHNISDIETNKNSWMFHIPTSVEVLKKNISSFWYVNFKVMFQHELSKSFHNIKIRIRNSDAKRISEA